MASGRIFRLGALAAATLALSAYQLPSHKDKLFAYAKVLESAKGGDELLIEYSARRDYYGRDTVPRYKAHWRYVSRGVRRHRKRVSYTADGRKHPMYVVGRTKSPRVAVVFVHGRNGNHRSGIRDETVGGNFNRLQNLLARGQGRYYSPTFTDFRAKGRAELAGLLTRIEGEAPKAKVVLACTSTGAALCWRLARDKGASGKIDGMVLLGGSWDDRVVGDGALPPS